MSSGKKIEVRIAAVGGDQAAAEVRKVENAVESLDTSAGTTGDGIDELNQQLGEVADGFEEAGEAASKMEGNVTKIARVQQAQVISQLAGQVGQLGSKLLETANDVEVFDAELARGMRNAGETIEQVSSAVGTMAIGFAAGGPLGAGIAGILVLLGETVKAWTDMETARARATKAAETAAELEQELATMLALGVDSYHAASDAAEELIRIRETSADAIDAEVSALERLNRIQNADDDAYKARRDREDAAAIRGGAAEEDVKIKRAQDDAALELRRLDREDSIATSGTREASNALIRAEGQLGATRVAPTATAEQIAAAEKTVEELRQRLATMEQKAEETTRINQARRTEIRERAAGRVEGFQSDKESRLAREREKAERKQQVEAEKKRREQEAATREAEQEAERRLRSEAGVGRDAKGLLGEAGKLLPKGLPEKFQRDTEAIIAGLQDGDQGGEAQKLADAMSRLAQAVAGRSAATDIKLQQLNSQIALINQKIKNK